MSDQAVNGLDLAEMEADAKEALAVGGWWPDDWAFNAHRLGRHIEALVAALRAAQQERDNVIDVYVPEANVHVEAANKRLAAVAAELDQLRADLVRVETNKELLSEENALLTLRVQRVEAERDQLVIHSIPLSTAAQSIDKFRKENERLQARIAELTHLIGDADTGLVERLSAALDRIAELEGSLRSSLEMHGRVDDGPCWCHACERARANLASAQTPSAS